MKKLSVLLIFILSAVNVCISKDDEKSSYNDDNYKFYHQKSLKEDSNIGAKYKFYHENPILKDSIIKSIKSTISKDTLDDKSNLLLGMIYMNEEQLDSAIIYLRRTMDICLRMPNGSLHFYPKAAFMLLDAYRYTYRFKELFDVYHIYWAFLQDEEYKEQLDQFTENLRKNVRWWFIDYSRQIMFDEFKVLPDSYGFAYTSESDYDALSKDNDMVRLIQNKTDKGYWVSVILLPLDSTVSDYYSLNFLDYELQSYHKLSSIDFHDKQVFTKEKISTLIQNIKCKPFDCEKISFKWQSVNITLDSGEPFEILIREEKE
jgi:hypothetical protein